MGILRLKMGISETGIFEIQNGILRLKMDISEKLKHSIFETQNGHSETQTQYF